VRAALHANDTLAREFFARHSWLDVGTLEGRLLGSLLWVPILLLLAPRYAVRRWRQWRRGF